MKKLLLMLSLCALISTAYAAIIITAPPSGSFTVTGPITFTDGAGNDEHDLNQYYAGSIPSGQVFSSVALASGSAALPTGVTVDSANERLAFDDSVGSDASVSGVVLEVTTVDDVSAHWDAESVKSGVFYANNFDYANRTAYLAGAHSYQYADTGDSKPKLDLETTIKLSGSGASRHNWYLSEGATEAGPAWNYSWDGPGASTTNTKKTEFYLQYSMYVDQGWVDFNNTDGDIKTQIIFNPGVPPFASGEIVHNRSGTGPWPIGFRVLSTALGWQLLWSAPSFVLGDDTYYTFWDGGPQSDGGDTDLTSINLFERRWGPRRRNMDRSDPDYANVPKFEGGKWYTFETYVNVSGSNSVLKIWFAERGQAPILLSGLMDMGISENTDTYRGAHLISRAENTTNWVSGDTFIVFDEIIASDSAINFPGGFSIPTPGTATPSGWPPTNSAPRD